MLLYASSGANVHLSNDDINVHTTTMQRSVHDIDEYSVYDVNEHKVVNDIDGGSNKPRYSLKLRLVTRSLDIVRAGIQNPIAKGCCRSTKSSRKKKMVIGRQVH